MKLMALQGQVQANLVVEHVAVVLEHVGLVLRSLQEPLNRFYE